MEIEGFKRIGVVGAGQMGAGIAQVCAMKGFEVTLMDSAMEQLERAMTGMERSLNKLAERSKLEGTPAESQSRVKTTSKLEDLQPSDLVVEAIIENETIKGELLSKVCEILPKDAIIASNTSSISITRLAAKTKRPDLFVGMHFMNPVPLMKLVEIIPGMATSDQTTQRIQKLAIGLGKEISTSRDYPGFVVNRILMPMINEAFTALMEGVASPEDIDKGMKLGTNQPMGPLQLADFIGLDTCLAIMKVLHQGLGDSKYRPCPLLIQYVDAGWFGRKSGRGVYQY